MEAGVWGFDGAVLNRHATTLMEEAITMAMDSNNEADYALIGVRKPLVISPLTNVHLELLGMQSRANMQTSTYSTGQDRLGPTKHDLQMV